MCGSWLTLALGTQTLYVPKKGLSFNTGPYSVPRKGALSPWNILPGKSDFVCLRSWATQPQYAQIVYANKCDCLILGRPEST